MRLSALVGTLALAAWVPAASAQDAKRGEHVFRKCLLCHVVEPGSTSSIAPPLNDVVGRRAGSIKGFQYSEIMQLARDKGLTWGEEALYQFLDKPEDFMPGTYMAFAGLEEQERRDVIAYLKQITARSREQGRGGGNQAAPKEPAVATQPQDPTAKNDPGQHRYLPSVPPSMLPPKSAAGR
jgi:cytochrome c